jgi:type II secretory pathway pseudopilin PulG
LAKKILIKPARRALFSSPSFSLIELIVAISIFVLILSFSIPKQSFFDDILLQHEIENLFTTFSYLQQKAIASNEKLELHFTQTSNSYFYPQGNASMLVTHTLPKAIKFGYLSNTKGPPSTLKVPITKAITFHNQTVTFLPNGKISPGAVYIIDNEGKNLKALTCPISQVSFIRKYTFAKKWIPC